MSPRDFDRQVGVYLDGEATRAQVLAIRRALRERPELKSRLASLVRLHQAQSSALTRRSRPSLALVLSQLRGIADRFGRSLAHACILVLVCVELDVAVPRVDSQAWVNGGRPIPVLMPVAEVLAAEVMGVVPDMAAPAADMAEEDADMADPMPADTSLMVPGVETMPSAASAMPVDPDSEVRAEG